MDRSFHEQLFQITKQYQSNNILVYFFSPRFMYHATKGIFQKAELSIKYIINIKTNTVGLYQAWM